MKTLLLFFTMVLAGIINVNAQSVLQRNCGTMEYMDYLKSQDPNLESQMQAMELKLQQYIAEHETELLSSKVVMTIPVVVHIVYANTAQNISDQRVNEQINILNADFAGLNANGQMYGFGSSMKANCEVQFCLAQRKPDGTATTGIERRSTTTTSFTSNDNVKHYNTGGLDAWDPTKYLNIWVCNLGGGLLGYAQFPTSGINSTFGVVILYSAFGVTGAAAPFNLGGTATHEVGHCLNLYHIWGDDGTACTGTDNCGDTPNQAGANTGCPSYPHVTCSNGTTGDMFMNFMDYSDDVCYNNFTPGQKARMQSLFISGGLLASLASSNGCQPPTTGGTCDPPSGLNATSVATTSATLNWNSVSAATSYNVQYRKTGLATWTSTTSTTTSKAITGLTAATAYEWQVQTVCSTGSSAFTASSTFTTAAVSTCTDVYEANNTQATAKSIAVNTNITAMIGTSTDADWFKFNNTTASKKIKITLTGLPADYDVRLYKSNGSQVGISQNSGTTSETIIYNTNTVGTYYIKVYGYNGVFSSTSCYTLKAAIQSTNFKGDEGGMEEYNTTQDLFVYPNPSTGNVNLELNAAADETYSISCMDITGRIVYEETLTVTKGMNYKQLDLQSVKKGLYIIEAKSGSQNFSQKLILQ